MANTYIDTNALPRTRIAGAGEVTAVLNNHLAGAKNVVATVHWLNRDDSLDSRFPAAEGGIGMVPEENLIGRATITFWSTDGSASYWKPWTWFTALRGSRVGNGYKGDAG